MEKFGKSADEMFEAYSVKDLLEMMAASSIQAQWIDSATNKPPDAQSTRRHKGFGGS
jgi:hypothetical protein